MDGQNNNPLLIACVLGRLFEFSDVESLKKSRLVCHTWNTIAGLGLRKRTKVYVTSKKELKTYQEIINGSFDENSKQIKNLCIRVSGGNGVLTRDVVKNVIISPCRNSIVSLRLQLPPNFKYDESLAEILQSLPVLECLDLCHNSHVSHLERKNKNIFRATEFPKLKLRELRCRDILLRCHYNNIKDTKTEFLRAFSTLLQSCEQTLKKLELQKLRQATYEEVFRQVNLTGLTYLSLEEPCESCWLPIDLVKTFPTLFPNLEYFEYCVSRNISYETVHDILSKMKNLRGVKLSSHKDEGYRFFNVSTPMTTFPTLPFVKSLTLKIAFSGDAEIFATALPQVNVLKLDLLNLKEHEWQPMTQLEELRLRNRTDRNHYLFTGFPHKGLTSENFPRLTKLEVQLTEGCAKVIFANLQNLKELLLIGDCGVTDEDMTGIEDLELANQGRIVRTNPYIGDLKNLRILYLGNSKTSVDSFKFGIGDLELLTTLTVERPQGSLDYPRSRRANAKKFDLEPLMLPKVKYLVALILIASSSHPCSVDSKQLEDMKRTRPGFSFKVKKSSSTNGHGRNEFD